MNKFILLCVQELHQFVLFASNVGEIERVRERNALKDLEYEIRPNLRIRDIAAYGKGVEIREDQAMPYIPIREVTWGTLYKCYANPVKFRTEEEYKRADIQGAQSPAHEHESAAEAWLCAWQTIGEPNLAMLVRLKLNIKLECFQ